MFQGTMKRRALLFACLPALVGTVAGLAAAAHAGTDVVIHGTVLSTQPQTKTFRVRVQETGKERTIFTSAQTQFRFSNSKAATFNDVKVGKVVELRVQERSADAYNASVVTIRL